ncbi:MAG: SapC family protein [Stagnimonas sp.]|nr:SapC family protein [Stagnimonas sp.]
MAASYQFLAPPGYGKLVPLDRQRHGALGLPLGDDHRWCSELNAVHLNAPEFAKAAADYPIAFVRDPDSGEFAPVAVLGLRAKQNLFVGADGRWQAHRYVPATVRRYPFCIAELPQDKGPPQRLVCVEEARLARGGTPLFAADGSPSPAWQQTQRLLEAVEGARLQTRVLSRRIEALGLLTPFEALALPKQGQRMRLQGLFRVDEERLQAVPGRDLRVLMRKGELRAIYAHLLSLENFARLMDLALERDAAEAGKA